MGFRDREKQRVAALAEKLFGPDAATPGDYKGSPRTFCLPAEHSARNLHDSIRDEAVKYFAARDIGWHDGLDSRRRPSNHMCCSQSACVNAWFPYRGAPTALGRALRRMGYPLAEILPFAPEAQGRDREDGAVAFEWIGLRNYLSETTRGRIALDTQRQRGAGFTSADFAFRFRREDGLVQMVLGEWKYTEAYGPQDKRFSEAGTDRLAIYGPFLSALDCPIRLQAVGLDALFFDPFDQLMRLQLLAKEMERARELGADIVSVLHVAPRANGEFRQITSKALERHGASPHAVWLALVGNDRFAGVDTEDLFRALLPEAPSTAWADWMKLRYGSLA